MLASSATGFVATDLCNTPHVDPNRRQGSLGPDASDQSLVECAAVRDITWLEHVADPIRREGIQVEIRFSAAPTCTRREWRGVQTLALRVRSVADFYEEFMRMLKSADIQVKIWRMPVEVADPIPFDQDHTHASYDPEFVLRFWRILLSVDAVLNQFRSGFVGKYSPVHFFWGSFDLAVSRFSGRRAPERAGADAMTREAYSHEVSSVGFWPGGGLVKGAAFYSYTVPEPLGFREAPVGPEGAYFDARLGEFVLMYDSIRTAPSPVSSLLQFCQSTYEAGAGLGKWDRKALER
jgi:hypothetical protein